MEVINDQNQNGYYNQNQYQQPYQNPYGYQQPNQNQMPPYPKPANNLVWGILTTILCCLPFGIVSIVFASKVDSLWYSGRYQESKDAARKAATWAIVSASIGILFSIIYIVFVVLAAAKGVSSGLTDYLDLY
ncbi:MAG: CD225/dispanin family protein [Bacteroidales bacterium]|nr:CD225/dispanin family protein [Bacteroidales bacterium]